MSWEPETTEVTLFNAYGEGWVLISNFCHLHGLHVASIGKIGSFWQLPHDPVSMQDSDADFLCIYDGPVRSEDLYAMWNRQDPQPFIYYNGAQFHVDVEFHQRQRILEEEPPEGMLPFGSLKLAWEVEEERPLNAIHLRRMLDDLELYNAQVGAIAAVEGGIEGYLLRIPDVDRGDAPPIPGQNGPQELIEEIESQFPSYYAETFPSPEPGVSYVAVRRRVLSSLKLAWEVEDSTPVIDSNGDTFWYNSKGKLHRTDGPAIERADGSKEWCVNDKLHRTDGPAVELADGGKEWWVNGKLHRTDGPAIEWADGSKLWYVNGRKLTEEDFNSRHQASLKLAWEVEDSTPVIDLDGDTFWYNSAGDLHRTDGPAVEYANGDKEWYVNDKLHRTDGPAVEYADGIKGWWVNGRELTEEEFNRQHQASLKLAWEVEENDNVIAANIVEFRELVEPYQMWYRDLTTVSPYLIVGARPSFVEQAPRTGFRGTVLKGAEWRSSEWDDVYEPELNTNYAMMIRFPYKLLHADWREDA